METKEKPLIGPRAHERERELKPEDVRLESGQPLYYVFLENPNPDDGVLDQDDVQAAKSRLNSIIAIDKSGVLNLHGKTVEEARSELEAIERKGERTMAVGAGESQE